jgi:DNA-binding beta-propeller fold protein YncE
VDGPGNLYRVVLTPDGFNLRIQKLSTQGAQVALWGTTGDGPGQLRSPKGLAVDGNDNLYVADSGNQSVQKLSPDGSPLAQWGVGGQGPDQWGSPLALAVDADGNIYVTFLGGVEKHLPEGELLTRWGSAQAGDQPAAGQRAGASRSPGPARLPVSRQPPRSP